MAIKSARRLWLIVVAAIFAVVGVLNVVQPTLALTNAGSITTLGVAVTENFDTLPSTGSATWVNNSTIPGWYHARTGTGTTVVADVGSNNAGNLYSYGLANNSDRALGSIGSSNPSAGSFFWGARLSNATGSTITSLTVSYVGEQWRSSAAAAQTVAFPTGLEATSVMRRPISRLAVLPFRNWISPARLRAQPPAH